MERRLAVGVRRVEVLLRELRDQKLEVLRLVPARELVQRREPVGVGARGVDLRRVLEVRGDGREVAREVDEFGQRGACLLYTSPSPRD